MNRGHLVAGGGAELIPLPWKKEMTQPMDDDDDLVSIDLLKSPDAPKQSSPSPSTSSTKTPSPATQTLDRLSQDAVSSMQMFLSQVSSQQVPPQENSQGQANTTAIPPIATATPKATPHEKNHGLFMLATVPRSNVQRHYHDSLLDGARVLLNAATDLERDSDAASVLVSLKDIGAHALESPQKAAASIGRRVPHKRAAAAATGDPAPAARVVGSARTIKTLGQRLNIENDGGVQNDASSTRNRIVQKVTVQGRVVASYASARAASMHVGVPRTTLRNAMLANKAIKGHYWRYSDGVQEASTAEVFRNLSKKKDHGKEDHEQGRQFDLDDTSQIASSRQHQRRGVQKCTVTGKVIAEYESIATATQHANVPRSTLRKAITDNKLLKGHHWRLADSADSAATRAATTETTSKTKASMVQGTARSSSILAASGPSALVTSSPTRSMRSGTRRAPEVNTALAKNDHANLETVTQTLSGVQADGNTNISAPASSKSGKGRKRQIKSDEAAHSAKKARTQSQTSASKAASQSSVDAAAMASNTANSTSSISSPRVSMAIEQYSLQTGKVKARFPSIRRADEHTGVSRNEIIKAIKGEIEHAGGYGWRRQDRSIESAAAAQAGAKPTELSISRPSIPQPIDHSVRTQSSPPTQAVMGSYRHIKTIQDYAIVRIDVLEGAPLGLTIQKAKPSPKILQILPLSANDLDICFVSSEPKPKSVAHACDLRTNDIFVEPVTRSNESAFRVAPYADIKRTALAGPRPVTWYVARKISNQAVVSKRREQYRVDSYGPQTKAHAAAQTSVVGNSVSSSTRSPSGNQSGSTKASSETKHALSSRASNLKQRPDLLSHGKEGARRVVATTARDSHPVVQTKASTRKRLPKSTKGRKIRITSKLRASEAALADIVDCASDGSEYQGLPGNKSVERLKNSNSKSNHDLKRKASQDRTGKVSKKQRRSPKQTKQTAAEATTAKRPHASNRDVPMVDCVRDRAQTNDAIESEFAASDDEIEVHWEPCRDPLAGVEDANHVVVLFGPALGIGHHETALPSPRFEMNPLARGAYDRTHFSKATQLLRLCRDTKGHPSWGFRCCRHEFGGACIVTSVQPLSAAHAATIGCTGGVVDGLRKYDLILAVNGKMTQGMTEVGLEIELETTGQQMMLVVVRYKHSSEEMVKSWRTAMSHEVKLGQILCNPKNVEWVDLHYVESRVQMSPDDESASQVVSVDVSNRVETNNEAALDSWQEQQSDTKLDVRQANLHERREKDVALDDTSAAYRIPIEIGRADPFSGLDLSSLGSATSAAQSADKPKTRAPPSPTPSVVDDVEATDGDDGEGCVCGRVHQRNPVYWICCDKCSKWYNVYHHCIGFSESEAKSKEWFCPACVTGWNFRHGNGDENKDVAASPSHVQEAESNDPSEAKIENEILNSRLILLNGQTDKITDKQRLRRPCGRAPNGQTWDYSRDPLAPTTVQHHNGTDWKISTQSVSSLSAKGSEASDGSSAENAPVLESGDKVFAKGHRGIYGVVAATTDAHGAQLYRLKSVHQEKTIVVEGANVLPVFAEGDLVHIHEHGWAGVNNPEGAARVLKVLVSDDGVLLYDIKYIIGCNRVSGVFAKFVLRNRF